MKRYLVIVMAMIVSACSSWSLCDKQAGAYPRTDETQALEVPPDLVKAEAKAEKTDEEKQAK